MKRAVLTSLLGAWLLLGSLLGGISAAKADWQEEVGAEKVRLLESYQAFPATFYVSPDGNDAWSGRLPEANADQTDGPFLTLARAQKAVREERQNAESFKTPTVVQIQKGQYNLTAPLVFTAEDSGTAASPVIWRGVGLETVINAGRYLKAPQPIADPDVFNALKPEVRDNVVQFDLKAAGITDFGDARLDNAQLFVDDNLMKVARYPNEGFIKIQKLVEEGTTVLDDNGTLGINEGKIYFEDEEFLKWGAEKNIYAFGYWFWDWDTARVKVVKIDPEKKMMEMEGEGRGYRVGQYYYVYNLLSELDAPGEFYIDREKGLLYFYPPKEYREDSILFTVLPQICQLNNVSHFLWGDCMMEGCRGKAVTFSGDSITLCGCRMKNMQGEAIYGEGTNIFIFGNQLYNLASGGILFNSGDREKLIAGGSAVVNNDIHDFGQINRVYTPALRPTGVGLYIAHNRMANAPHAALLCSGLENLIEYNEITNVCFESCDAGAIYLGGVWTDRGNRIRYNYLHDIQGIPGRGCNCIYLDDQYSGIEISGNLFARTIRSAFIGGGRDNKVFNNLFIDCFQPFFVDARGLNWQAKRVEGWIKEFKESQSFYKVKVTESPLADRYPSLAKIVDDHPGAPVGTLFARNIVISREGTGTGDLYRYTEDGRFEDEALPYITFDHNILGDDRLLSVIAGVKNSENPILRELNFEPIPFEKMGLFDHPAAARGKK